MEIMATAKMGSGNWATAKLGNKEWRSRKKGNIKLMSGSNSTLPFEPPEQQP